MSETGVVFTYYVAGADCVQCKCNRIQRSEGGVGACHVRVCCDWK